MTSRQWREKRYYLLRGMAGAAAVVGIASMFVIALMQHQPDAQSKHAGTESNAKSSPSVTATKSSKVDTWKAPGAFQNPTGKSNEPIADGEPGLIPTRGVVGPTLPVVLGPTPTPTETAKPQPRDTPTPEPSNPSKPNKPSDPRNPFNPPVWDSGSNRGIHRPGPTHHR